MAKHVAILYGGWSAEREVSLASGKACCKALEDLGYKVTPIDVQPDIATVLGGGWIASGPPAASRQPLPVWPSGLRTLGREGATGDKGEGRGRGERLQEFHGGFPFGNGLRRANAVSVAGAAV